MRPNGKARSMYHLSMRDVDGIITRRDADGNVHEVFRFSTKRALMTMSVLLVVLVILLIITWW